MPPPSLFARIRHSLGRALRETGQALDRVGIRGQTHATSKRIVNDDPYLFDLPLSRHRNILPLLRRGAPIIEGGGGPISDLVFIAPCSTIIGSVRIGEDSSVWYGAMLRADNCNNGLGRHSSPEEQLQWEKEHWLKMTDEEKAHDDKTFGGNFKRGGGIYIGKGTNVQDGVIIT